MGYLLWIFGFLGAHRFYFGRSISGTIYLFTFGLLGICWLIDLFLMPRLEAQADRSFADGPINYTVTWLFLVFLGPLGVHRFYLGKLWTGLLYLVTKGLVSFGVIYDCWTINRQISDEKIHLRYYY